MTLRERYTQYLLAVGCEEIPSKSRKYLTFKSLASDSYYFLGKSGAIRYSKTSNSTQSFDVAMQMRSKLQAWEKQQR